MGGFSALCLFEAGAITAVSGPYLYTEQTQNRCTLIQPDRVRVSVCAHSNGADVMRLEKGDLRLCTVQSKINRSDLWCGP